LKTSKVNQVLFNELSPLNLSMVVVRSITRINSFCGWLGFWLTNGFYTRLQYFWPNVEAFRQPNGSWNELSLNAPEKSEHTP
jgi:hypothetical protein